ncbi:MAG: CDP-2,3-bis-(O-geranylgeranyl)-sn-glycerol synthase [Candidatus Bathyarchaeia archaeon]
MELAQLLLEALKFIFPAYCANAIPVVMGGGLPIDFGKNFFDGKPIFGKNKTYKGFFSGILVGTLVGLVESYFFGYPLLFGLVLSIGALLGDLFGAFIKRRVGLAPGDLFPVVDQIDFIVGAILFSMIFKLQTLSLELVLTVFVITPPMHLLTNFLAYKLHLKSSPW